MNNEPTGTASGTAKPTWTFFGHWDDDEIVVEYAVPGIVEDDRVDTGCWEGGLWAASASGATVEEAQAAAVAEYENDLIDTSAGERRRGRPSRIVGRHPVGVRTVAGVEVKVTRLVWGDGGQSFEVHRTGDGKDLTEDWCFDTDPTDAQLTDLIRDHREADARAAAPAASEQTWTFFGHWEDDDRIVVEYYLPGIVEDQRVDTGDWVGGLWSDSASGATVEEAQAAAVAEYENDIHD